MIPAPTRYVRAGSLDEALEALAEPDATALAGGQSLVSVMKLRLARPALVVDIGRLDLAGLDVRDGELRIGALTTWADLAAAPELRRPALAALAECAAKIGDLQVRNRGTIGGGLAHADPASDMPAVVLALGATLVVRSAEGERAIQASEFFLGPFTSALGERDLLTEVVVPLPPAGSGSAYAAVDHPASGFALAGAAALVRPRRHAAAWRSPASASAATRSCSPRTRSPSARSPRPSSTATASRRLRTDSTSPESSSGARSRTAEARAEEDVA